MQVPDFVVSLNTTVCQAGKICLYISFLFNIHLITLMVFYDMFLDFYEFLVKCLKIK